MASVLNALRQAGFAGVPASCRQFVERFETQSLRTGLASQALRRLFLGTRGAPGPLGPVQGRVVPTGRGFTQKTLLGTLDLDDLDLAPIARASLEVDVTLAAIGCFGTQDSGDDETFAVITLYSIDPNRSGGNQVVRTFRTPIQSGVKPGTALFKSTRIGAIEPVGTGIGIHVAVWDHESGDADEIERKIADVIRDGVGKAATALAGSAVASDPSASAGTIGDITSFEVGGIKPFEVLTLGLAGLIAGLLADDLVGERHFIIPATNLLALADQATFSASVRRPPDLDGDIQFNWPTPELEPQMLLTNGDGTYKAYFLLRSRIVPPFPVTPSLP